MGACYSIFLKKKSPLLRLSRPARTLKIQVPAFKVIGTVAPQGERIRRGERGLGRTSTLPYALLAAVVGNVCAAQL